jgi:hypothetical protein
MGYIAVMFLLLVIMTIFSILVLIGIYQHTTFNRQDLLLLERSRIISGLSELDNYR